jgi:hypothetical protein
MYRLTRISTRRQPLLVVLPTRARHTHHTIPPSIALPTWQVSASRPHDKVRSLALICSLYILLERVILFQVLAKIETGIERVSSSTYTCRKRRSEDIEKRDSGSSKGPKCRRSKALPLTSISLWLSGHVLFMVLTVCSVIRV